MAEHSTPTERVSYGLDTIPTDRMVTVPLRDLMYAHQAFGEFVRFFHQRLHYPDVAAVHRFLGSRGSGDAIDVLWESYYERMRKMIPADIDEAFADGERFEHPLTPSYFDPDNDNATS
jgi:hypothetical protein